MVGERVRDDVQDGIGACGEVEDFVAGDGVKAMLCLRDRLWREAGQLLPGHLCAGKRKQTAVGKNEDKDGESRWEE